jgi:hypothetical protein
MSSVTAAQEEMTLREEKRAALGHVHEAWSHALMEGIDGDALAQACLFSAFVELVTTYGEEASAQFAEGLALRIRNGEFSVELSRQ